MLNRWIARIIACTLLATLASEAARAEASESDANTLAPPTQPDSTDVVDGTEGDDQPDPPDIPDYEAIDRLRDEAFQHYADKYNMSFEEAAAEIDLQGRMAEWATLQRRDAAYAGFRIERDESGHVFGVLAQVAGHSFREEPPRSFPLQVVTARLSESEFRDKNESLVEAVQKFSPSVIAVDYDPFDDALVVWIKPEAGDDATPGQPAVEEAARTILGQAINGTGFKEKRAPAPEEARGGMNLDGPDPARCTTGWGVRRWNVSQWQYGYMTAGHCYGNPGLPATWPWSVERTSGSYSSIISPQNWDMGTYQDRVIFTGPGVSQYTRVYANGTSVNMGSPEIHPFAGLYTCHYGASALLWNCDEILAVNVPWAHSGSPTITTYSSVNETVRRWDLEQTCVPGDSGGPVFTFVGEEYRPAGMIVATDNILCYYVSVVDSLNAAGNWLMY